MKSGAAGTHSSRKIITGLKSSLGALLVLTVLYGIYQLVVGMYLAGSFWFCAGILGMLALFGKSEKAVLAGLALYTMLMIAAMITHIVYLATFDDYATSNYNARVNDNATVPDMGFDQSKETWFGSHIAGLIASVLGLAVVIPMLLKLRGEHRRHSSRKAGMEKGYGGANRNYAAAPTR